MAAARRRVWTWLIAVVSIVVLARPATAQSTEDRFHDLFVTAGYSTAFGAALGTAFLAFKDNPADNLQFVAIGASLGFIGGSVMGSYIIFSPMIAETSPEQTVAPSTTLLAGAPVSDRGLTLRPTYNRTERRFTAIEGAFTLATF